MIERESIPFFGSRGMRALVFLGLACGALGYGVARTRNHAIATEPPLPAKMPRDKVLELENAVLRLQAILVKAETEAAPFVTKRNAVCAEFKINPEELGKSVGISEDGAITRGPSAPELIAPATAPASTTAAPPPATPLATHPAK